MSQRNNILDELIELQSSLVNALPQNIYGVPEGYFESLAEQVLNRVKALEAGNASEELNYLSPLLKSISKKTIFSVPAEYFDGLEKTMLLSVQKNEEILSPAEELESLSPLLGGLKKQMPYSVPDGYFEGLNKTINTETVKSAAKLVPITKQKWFRYAAAAVVTGFIIMAGFLTFKNSKIDPIEKPQAWIEKSLKKVNTDEIDEFAELAEEGTLAVIDAKTEIKEAFEVKELIKDISDKEIQEFLEETQPNETDIITEDLFMN